MVVDEAYHEYVTDPDYPDAIAEHVAGRPNVAVLRTFSKIYGLAGLRVGYMVGPAEVVREAMKVRNAVRRLRARARRRAREPRRPGRARAAAAT